jgi:hypothetical protein
MAWNTALMRRAMSTISPHLTRHLTSYFAWPPHFCREKRLEYKLPSQPIYDEVRGASHGHDVDDWLEAERQILAGLKSDKATLRVALAFGLLNSER